MSLRFNFKLAAAGVFLAVSANPLFACSACYGDPNSSLSKGLVWGISILLGVVVTVLGGLATFFVYLAKKSPATPADSALSGSTDTNRNG